MCINNYGAIGFIELCVLAVGEVCIMKVALGFYAPSSLGQRGVVLFAYRQAQMDTFFT